jgi:hypothetical protein
VKCWGDVLLGNGEIAYGSSPIDVLTPIDLAAGYYTFSTAIAGTGTGSLAGSTGNSNYLGGTKITLVATPATGSTFAGWTPATCIDGFALTANTVCTATFNVGSGTGTAVPSENCAASYDLVSGRLVIPCVTVTTGTQVSNYSVELQQREGVFTFDLDLNKVIQK